MNESNADPAFEAGRLTSVPEGTSGWRLAAGATTFPVSFCNRKRSDGSKRKRFPGCPHRRAHRLGASPLSAAMNP